MSAKSPARSLAFDWIDGLLLAAGFVALIVVLTSLRSIGVEFELDGALGELAVVAAVFGPWAARRALFGAPRLPEPRRGVVASAVSIVGLLATFAGAGVALLGGLRFGDGFASAPDFLAEARASHEEAARSIDPLLESLGSPATGEVVAARAAAVRESAAEARASWEATRAARRREGGIALGVALALLGLGAAASRWRYSGARPTA
ncbi:MAG: hypothetical protein IT376_09320 [Polyangiaceae bacterium]|nr:hypothetical protein [Polyangiaceae bacterium]